MSDDIYNPTMSDYDFGWEHGCKARQRYAASDAPNVFSFVDTVKVPDVVEDEGSPSEYLRGYRDGLIHALGDA